MSASARERASAKPLRHVRRWLARLVAGQGAEVVGTESRGASNAEPAHSFAYNNSMRSGRFFLTPLAVVHYESSRSALCAHADEHAFSSTLG
jgi:hypothetical protein